MSEMLCLHSVVAERNITNNANNNNAELRLRRVKQIAPGTSFIKDGKYYKVTASHNTSIVAACLDDFTEITV